ncbi:MAG: hypothetical protein ABI823_20560, partial [Bryobacteraceae bacterium]
MKIPSSTAAGAILVGAFAIALISCQTAAKTEADNAARAPIPVHAVPVRMFTPQSGERYTASLTASRQLMLSFRVAGFVESIYGGVFIAQVALIGS